MGLMNLDAILSRSHVVSLPLRVQFRGITTREALLIDGPAGWGEFAPFLEYTPPEAAHWLASALEVAFQGLPTPPRRRVPVNATVPAVPAAQVPEILARYPGCQTVKVKVAEAGQTLAEDVARVEAARAELPTAQIRVDANRGWTVPQAEEAARVLGELEYMEQPCWSVEELAELRTLIDTPVAADESIRKAEDPYRVADAHAADVGVVKVAPLGGVRRTLEVAEYLQRHGMGVTIASALDTAVGMNAGLAAAALLPESRAAGLATGALFLEDVAEPRQIVDGCLDVEPINPDPARVEALAVTTPRRDWWFNRVKECWDVLQEEQQ